MNTPPNKRPDTLLAVVKADAGRSFINAIEMLDHDWRIVELP
jgi:hypothetical protein